MDGTRAEELVERYADAILRIGYTWLGDMDDAKDICQTVLIKLVEEGRRFPDLGQERAWVVRLSVNACKNWKKSAWFRRRAPLEEGLHALHERVALLVICLDTFPFPRGDRLNDCHQDDRRAGNQWAYPLHGHQPSLVNCL